MLPVSRCSHGFLPASLRPGSRVRHARETICRHPQWAHRIDLMRDLTEAGTGPAITCAQPSARIAIPAPEHACRYDHKTPATLVALQSMPHPDRVHAPEMRRMPSPLMRRQACAGRTM